MPPEDDDEIVHNDSIAVRLRVPSRNSIQYERLAWPSLTLHSQTALPYPQSGYGGSVLSISPSSNFAAALVYSGQGEIGYELFALAPTIQRVGGLPYVEGESDLTPIVFSPDERLAALAIERFFWWTDPDEPDPDWETPAIGGVVDWATLYVHRVGEAAPSSSRLRVDLPSGWCPGSDGTWPRCLRFSDSNHLVLRIPWRADFEFALPEPNGSVIVPPPRFEV